MDKPIEKKSLGNILVRNTIECYTSRIARETPGLSSYGPDTKERNGPLMELSEVPPHKNLDVL